MMQLFRSVSFVTSLVIAALLIGALIQARSFAESARFVPQLFGWLTLGLVCIDIARQIALTRLRSGTTRSDAASAGNPPTIAPPGESLRVIAYVLAFWLLVLIFGFNGVPGALIWAYLVVEARVRWYLALAAAAVGNVGILLGMSGLGVRIWTGAGPEIVPDFIGGENWPMF